MQRLSILVFGLVAYGVFFATFLYLIAFTGNLQLSGLADVAPWLPALIPYSLDAGRETGALGAAVAVDVGLILLFGLQHSIMARTGFKAWVHRVLPAPAERSVYVLVASGVLILMMWQWRPIPVMLWDAQSTWGQALGWTLFGAGFAIVLLSTLLIDHFELFGLRQVWLQFVQRRPADVKFVTPLFYRVVRHPLYFGFLLAFWTTPGMSVGRVVFAASMTAYILIAIRLEERDLVGFHGSAYERYRARVPMLLPLPGRRSGT